MFKSQLVKEGEDFLLKKAPQKTLRILDPTRTSPFVAPTKKRLLQETFLWRQLLSEKSPVVFLRQGNTKLQRLQGSFLTQIGEEGMETPLPNDSSKASQSTSRRSPPFFQKRLVNKQLFIKRVKHYHQWLHTAIPLKTKLGQIFCDSIKIQGPSKRPSSKQIASSLFCQRKLSKGWKM